MVRPVPASYRPKISQAQGLDLFKNRFPDIAQRDATEEIQLGLYSSDKLAVTWPAVHLDRPAWIIHTGNAEGSPVAATVVIDADTGETLGATQAPAAAG